MRTGKKQGEHKRLLPAVNLSKAFKKGRRKHFFSILAYLEKKYNRFAENPQKNI